MNFSIDAEIFRLFIWFPVWIFLLYRWTKKWYSIQKNIIYLFVYIYSIYLIGYTFFPLDFSPDWFSKTYTQLIPFQIFRDMYPYWMREMYIVIATQIWWNIALLLPAWFFLQLLFSKYKTYTQAIFIWFSLSLVIESLQLYLSYFIVAWRYKIFDVDDLILNTLGFVLGFLAYNLVMKIIRLTKYKKTIVDQIEKVRIR